jgi:apolipoprotein N-acyltransferase
MKLNLILAAVFTGIALRFVVGLEPVWWLAWIAPALLLTLAFRVKDNEVHGLVSLAALVATSANFVYYTKVMSSAAAVFVVLAQALPWIGAVLGARRIVLRYKGWWTTFVYPVFWTAIDTLMATALPDGNWGNIGYSQYSFLPLLQLTSLSGVAGVTFIVSLTSSALAMALTFGLRASRTQNACAFAALFMLSALTYGTLRLRTTPEGQEVAFGLVAIDDAIGMQATSAYADHIWQQYEEEATKLRQQGARIIVLPEKVAVLSPSKAVEVQRRFAALANRLDVWIEIGIAVDDGGQRSNWSWLLSPQGTLAQSYQKHFMAPTEREYLSGHVYNVQRISGQSYGLAICKDMHFGSFGRSYGQLNVDVMLVPAWDFHDDRYLAYGMTVTRGVENGYAIVRSSREGLLTVSDAYGRILAQQESAFMPGTSLLAKVKVAPQLSTFYTKFGNWLGWLCMVCLAGFAVMRVNERYALVQTAKVEV